MNMNMSWESIIAGIPALVSLAGFLLAALHICWRAGSLHPLNNRLLRLFISRDDIQDELVRKNLSDYSALAVFRMTYGIPAQTLKDAKEIIGKAESRNIPLDLVGRARSAFETTSFTINPRKRPHPVGIALSAFLLFVIFWFAAVLGLGAMEDRLLASLKATGTWVWLDDGEAQLVLPLSSEQRTILSAASCLGDPGAPHKEAPTGFHANDPAILCDIWRDPSVKAELTKAVRKQRQTVSFAAIFLFWTCFVLYSLIRRAVAIRILDRLVMPQSAIPPVIGKHERYRILLLVRLGTRLDWRLRVPRKRSS
ncbi:DUF6216 family protein [Lysobacter sp. A378]